MDIRPAKKQELGKIMTLKSYMDKQRAAAERKEKRQAKSLYLWAGYRRVAVRGRIKTPRQKLRAVVDKLWGILMVRRTNKKTGGLCEICLQRPTYCGYHIVPKQRGDAIRWDLENGCGSCARCNNAERLNRSLYQDTIHPRIFGHEKIAMLKKRAEKTVHFSMPDLKEMETRFTRLITMGDY